uniref:Uncharacterized protein n=1 Tax=Rheinheimera sp. BAL341 TaxID=1708203 RepID=A0A486XRP7_9GAMM
MTKMIASSKGDKTTIPAETAYLTGIFLFIECNCKKSCDNGNRSIFSTVCYDFL